MDGQKLLLSNGEFTDGIDQTENPKDDPSGKLDSPGGSSSGIFDWYRISPGQSFKNQPRFADQ